LSQPFKVVMSVCPRAEIVVRLRRNPATPNHVGRVCVRSEEACVERLQPIVEVGSRQLAVARQYEKVNEFAPHRLMIETRHAWIVHALDARGVNVLVLVG